METALPRKVNVTAVFANFKTPKFYRRITPMGFEETDGTIQRIAHIRRTYIEKVGEGSHIHFVVRTEADRYFDLVFDTRKMVWFVVLELEETLFFNE
jgi:hypothetical protein